MRRIHRVLVLVSLLAVGPVLAGCSNFDPDSLDVFGLNEKKKLPGERKELFPGGVPGVSQGIPQEYIKGNQPPPETAQAAPAEGQAAQAKTAAVQPAEEVKPKPKAKPKPRTASRPTRLNVGVPATRQQAPAQQQQQQQPASAPWPDQQPQQQPQQQPAQQSPWPASNQATSTAPWPSAPPPGTFSKQ